MAKKAGHPPEGILCYRKESERAVPDIKMYYFTYEKVISSFFCPAVFSANSQERLLSYDIIAEIEQERGTACP